MSRRKPSVHKTTRTAKTDDRKRKDRGDTPSAKSQRSHVPSPAAIRETIESVVVAFVLAFLFRTFEAEAFVIPTGSMAPTLMGRHKDLECPICGNPYQISASDEVNSETGVRQGSPIEGGSCPMCRYPAELGPDNPQQGTYPSFKGDRILVSKFCYQFAEPERWDVAVFRYPGGAKTNFIKRLVGLPGETVRISHGDILSDDRQGNGFTIARKSPEKLLAMLQPVYDNDVTPRIVAHGWPARWRRADSLDADAAGAWETSEDYRTFQTDGTSTGDVWIRYEHRVPSFQQWQELDRSGAVPEEPRRQLISDFCGYNTGRDRASIHYSRQTGLEGGGLHWVGDLALKCTLEVESDAGGVILELVEGGRRMQCHLDIASGTATLTIDGLDAFRPTAETDVHGPGTVEIIFSNVDDQLRLWVDGDLVSFGESDAATCFPPLNNHKPKDGAGASDLSPVGVASRGAALRVSHLEILRDIYYIAIRPRRSQLNGAITDFKNMPPRQILSDPNTWYAFDDMREVDFPLGDDQFLALGDNSARSKDSRLWEQGNFEYYVSRDLLIGKALYIYWPHSWDKLPYIDIWFPFFPNIPRMGLVR